MNGKSSNIALTLMFPGVLITLLVGVARALFPVQGKAVVDSLFGILTHNFKWAFLIFGLFCVIFLIWLAFSKWGDIRLGGPDDEPEFSTYAWAAMIFCAGIGIAIVYWAFIEPVYYLNSSILHTDLESQKGLVGELAGMYGQFHWGITPWAIYALPTLPIAYAIHVKKIPALRLSTAFFYCRGTIAYTSITGMVFSLMKWVKEDYGELLARKVVVLPVEAIKKSE